MRHKDKVALVIGASRGSGKQIAIELAREGADVAIAARTERPDQSEVSGTIHQTAQEIEALGRRALPVKVDLAVNHEIDEMYRAVIAEFGRIDILIHSVQYMGPGYFGRLLETPPEQWEIQFKVNLLSAMQVTQLVGRHMAERGSGVIVLMTAAAAWRELPRMPGEGGFGVAYPVTKAGLNRFVVGAAKELTPYGVTVIGVDPGFTLSETIRDGAVDGVFNGWDIRRAHAPEVPAQVVSRLCAMPDLLDRAGQIIEAEAFLEEHAL